ncbi:hypothetical protein ACRALDRAFT_1035139 [Sodiomyces alcalophilus JCM 7366]|uniref:uncharacterized protein n=1 Tax=Sodiomyces alcalophilus JCM 7366 TaxID=591952 RepID=UPI0039B52E42
MPVPNDARVPVVDEKSQTPPLPLWPTGGIRPRGHPNPQRVGRGTFEQLVDHGHPSGPTFKQRYWFNDDYWGGPGSPVFMLNAGEMDAGQGLGWLRNDTLPGMYAKVFNAALILFEHRYFGESLPYEEFTAETLQHLNIRQSIADQTRFAMEVELAFDPHGRSNADQSPWVLIGGSYPGALAAWTSRLEPGVFAAYHASSAVVEAIDDFWTYYAVTEAALPPNCSANVRRVVSHLDHVLIEGSEQDIRELKEQFGLESLDQASDFVAYLAQPLGQWQANPGSVFKFCDRLEAPAINGTVVLSDEKSGVGLEAALAGYSTWIKEQYGEKCANGACSTFGHPEKFNQPHDLSANRAWFWLLCNEPFNWWQVGPPVSDGKNIVSGLLRPPYYQRMCDMYFPESGGFTPGSSMGRTTEDANWYTGGWNAHFDKVLFCDGENDPWISATLSSPFRPDGPRESTDQTPVLVMKGGNHVPDFDLRMEDGEFMDFVDKEVEIIGEWLKDWTPCTPSLNCAS